MKRLGIWLIAALSALVLACSGGGSGNPPGGGKAGGPVPMTMAKLFGVQSVNVGARAVAIIGYPNAFPPHGAFPMAVSQNMLDNYTGWFPWLFFSNFPTVSLGDNSVNWAGGSWWTTFAVNNTGLIQGLETPGSGFGNPTSLNLPSFSNQTGSSIWVQPWNASTDIAANFQAAAPWVGQTVLLPVINSGTGYNAITGVVPFYISGVSNNSIQGKFVVDGIFNNNQQPAAIMAGSTPGGPPSYTLTPPKLVQ
jgi:hypothetical protein